MTPEDVKRNYSMQVILSFENNVVRIWRLCKYLKRHVTPLKNYLYIKGFDTFPKYIYLLYQ